MKYIVIKSHVSNYPDPIRLEEGDVVKIGKTGCFVTKRNMTGKGGFRSKL